MLHVRPLPCSSLVRGDKHIALGCFPRQPGHALEAEHGLEREGLPEVVQSGHTHLLQGQLIRENALHVLVLTRGVKVVGAYLKQPEWVDVSPRGYCPSPLPSVKATLGLGHQEPSRTH